MGQHPHRVREAVEAEGLEDVRFYDPRHTVARPGLSGGVVARSLKEAQEALGPATFDMTLTYVR